MLMSCIYVYIFGHYAGLCARVSESLYISLCIVYKSVYVTASEGTVGHTLNGSYEDWRARGQIARVDLGLLGNVVSVGSRRTAAASWRKERHRLASRR